LFAQSPPEIRRRDDSGHTLRVPKLGGMFKKGGKIESGGAKKPVGGVVPVLSV
jgi:hypothetical protein